MNSFLPCQFTAYFALFLSPWFFPSPKKWYLNTGVSTFSIHYIHRWLSHRQKHTHSGADAYKQHQYQIAHILINSSTVIKHNSLSSQPGFYEEKIVFQAAESVIITLFEGNKGALKKQMRVIITCNRDRP